MIVEDRYVSGPQNFFQYALFIFHQLQKAL